MENKKTKFYVTSKDKMPNEAHYAILEFGSYSSRGYDKGDPDYSSPMASYIAFTDREEWIEEIKRLAKPSSYTSFVAFEAGKPVSTRIEVVVE